MRIDAGIAKKSTPKGLSGVVTATTRALAEPARRRSADSAVARAVAHMPYEPFAVPTVAASSPLNAP
jgi:hypothetical protein